jgi:hypothetical protein
MSEVPADIQDLRTICLVDHVGSRETCDPPPEDTDDDWLAFDHPCSLDSVDKSLEQMGFETGYVQEYVPEDPKQQGKFKSYRKGDLNVIVVYEGAFRMKFLAATALAKQWNLQDKAARIQLFQQVLYG